MKFETEMERFLFEERKQYMKERDVAIKKIEELQQQLKEESNFSVYMLKTLNEGIQYGHPVDDSIMTIFKDNKTIILLPEEIKEVVKCAGGNFNR